MNFNRLRIISVLLILLFSLNGCHAGRSIFLPRDAFDESLQGSAGDDSEEDLLPTDENGDYRLFEGVYLEEVFPYSGQYIEDGSNDPCENIAAVRIVNHSDIPYQYCRFVLQTSAASYTFSASTLFPGTAMTVLNEERAGYKEGTVLSCELLANSPFTETPSLHNDVLKITGTDNFINVKNLSDHTLNHVYVYYKNTDSDGFFGGITYRAYFETVESGQIVQSMVENLRKEGSAIVFVTYDD